jgi:hypothetical protein
MSTFLRRSCYILTEDRHQIFNINQSLSRYVLTLDEFLPELLASSSHRRCLSQVARDTAHVRVPSCLLSSLLLSSYSISCARHLPASHALLLAGKLRFSARLLRSLLHNAAQFQLSVFFRCSDLARRWHPLHLAQSLPLSGPGVRIILVRAAPAARARENKGEIK